MNISTQEGNLSIPISDLLVRLLKTTQGTPITIAKLITYKSDAITASETTWLNPDNGELSTNSLTIKAAVTKPTNTQAGKANKRHGLE
jgi:hypothetical protein